MPNADQKILHGPGGLVSGSDPSLGCRLQLSLASNDNSMSCCSTLIGARRDADQGAIFGAHLVCHLVINARRDDAARFRQDSLHSFSTALAERRFSLKHNQPGTSKEAPKKTVCTDHGTRRADGRIRSKADWQPSTTPPAVRCLATWNVNAEHC